MKFSTTQALLGAVPLAAAFPAAIFEAVASNNPALAARAEEIRSQLDKRQVAADGATKLFEPVPIFNEKAQFIDVGPGSGHEYVAPGPNDLRGPCPGLNAFANHGFLPHNGYATITQFIDATMNVVGMGPVLAGFLAVLGATIDGDGTSWSIGGTPGAGIGGPLSSQGHGISGSHNKYESDASPTRGDLYQSGDDYKTIASQFQELINVSPNGVVTLDSLTTHRSNRFDHQIATNPYFFNGPFTGVLVQPAAYTFIYRFMANHSAEHPYGELTYDVIKAWFGISGDSGSYVANQGQEHIPMNWYRRAIEYPYDNTYFLADVANAAALYPKFLNVGGNTGTTNSFTGIDVRNLSGGVFNSASLAQDNNFACFAYQFAAQAKPDLALAALTQLTNSVGSLIGKLGCPQLQDADDAQLMQFPGYSRSTKEGITK
ncbi:uncharacterized protein MYCFIDRAFT_50025 [Pseudocercospora fijiensis CIRAD86]|uniref:Heme haloperoxidase family profile domain-containing protein n=1 Tax=Pseudocercospora fijiensis (strain CIRAD86) TaxID=383855 RepID=M3ATT4_PSEFD|nr:uncharacterized protein MYCFIDRAFT_50025 [Pseudocercospora fijiensis CIRAD86]EME80568.1 hypothetical protein MYCFIDRAFT_50025 [Pseudocercospora fijiensis CIRAD86]